MTYTVGICGLKGGAGKTNLAVNLADFLHAEGKRVLLVDADPQATAKIWADIAAEVEHDSATVALCHGASMKRTVTRLAEGFDVVIIDTPPRLEVETRSAMRLANLVLLPVSPGHQDAWALAGTLEQLAEVLDDRPDLTARIVLNRVDTRTTLAAKLREAAEETEVPVLDTSLGNRVAYPEALGAGMGVATYAASSEAADELAALVAELRKDGLL